MATIERKHFSLSCRDEMAEQGIWLANLVESLATQGRALVAGTSFQVGWSVLKLEAHADCLNLCEPDFDGNPFADWRNDVSATLSVLHQQRQLLARVGCSPVDVRFDDSVVICKGCLEEPGIYGERNEPGQGDSGWYLGPTREHKTPEASELESIWIFQLLHRRPHLLAAMCLPAGWMVVWEGNELIGIANEDNEEVLR